MNTISQTLNCKNILIKRKKENLPVYNFGLGENPLNTHFYYRKMVQSCANYKHYTSSSGIDELQTSIKKFYSSENYTVDNIILGNGLKELLFLVQLSFTGKIFHINPAWISYKEQIKILKKEDDLVIIDTYFEDKFKINFQILEKKFKEFENYPKLIIFNNPNNPTGLVYDNEDVEKLANLVNKYNCIVFADEIYFNIIHEKKINSISKYVPHLTIKGTSVSKDLACGGYRLGWITFPKELKELFKICKSNASSIYSSANTPIQYATNCIYVKKEYLFQYFKNINFIFKKVADVTAKILNESNILYHKTEAAWYVFINLKNYKDKLMKININNSEQLANYLINKFGIITVAGSYFGSKELTLRLSLVDLNINLINSENFTENLEKGLKILTNFFNNL